MPDRPSCSVSARPAWATKHSPSVRPGAGAQLVAVSGPDGKPGYSSSRLVSLPTRGPPLSVAGVWGADHQMGPGICLVTCLCVSCVHLVAGPGGGEEEGVWRSVRRDGSGPVVGERIV